MAVWGCVNGNKIVIEYRKILEYVDWYCKIFLFMI